jgi:hypothetical protein
MTTLFENGRKEEETTDILTLAQDIVNCAAKIQKLNVSQDLRAPNFTPSSTVLPNTPEYSALSNRLVGALDDLRLLVVGPRRTMLNLICQCTDLAALQVAFEFDFFTIVPNSEDGIALEEVARKADMDVSRAGQVLRILCTYRIFREVKQGRFTHTANSAAIRRDNNLLSTGQFAMGELFKASAATVDAIKASPQLANLSHSPYKAAFGVTIFEHYNQKPELGMRFAKAMAGAAGGT